MTPIMENDDLLELQTKYEDLLLEFEAQRTMKDIVVDSLMKKLAEAESFSNRKQSNISYFQLSESSSRGGKNLTVRESQAIIVIKQLQEQIEVLEMEKSSMQSDLDSLVDLATKQNEAAQDKYEELHQELLDAREAAIVAREHLCSATTDGAFEDHTIKFSMEVQGMILEVQHSRDTVNGFLSVVNDLFQSLSLVSNTLLEFKPSICQSIVHLKSIGDNQQKLCSFLTSKVEELEKDKAFLHKQSTDQHNQIEELKLNIQNSENAQQENCQGQALEKAEFESQIRVLEKEICSLSSSSLVREKESLRKELEKAKTKLKDTEFKLKNCIQDKIKIEGEKAYAERELKQLHGQKNLLERNISKRESLADKRRDSKAFDLNKTKSQIGKVEQSLQLTAMELERTNFDYEILLGDCRKLEASTFEMGEKIASLEEELTTTLGEKEEALTRNGILASELEAASNMLNTTNAQLKILQEEIASLSLKLGESESLSKQMESSISLLSREKEEVAMQLTDALLQLEEENAVWSDKEKSFIESITEQAKVRHEMDYYREQCEVFKELLNLSEEKVEQEKKTSMEKSLEIDQLTNDLTALEAQSVQCQEVLKSRIDILSSEHHLACEEVERLQKQLNVVNEERERLSLQIKEMDTGLDQSTDWKPNLPKNPFITSDGNEKLLATNKELKKIMTKMEDKKASCRELEMLKQNYDVMLSNARIDVEELSERVSSLEAKISEDDLKFNKESTKLRMRLRMTQLKLDAIRGRHREAVDELELVDRKFKEASAKLKEQLVSSRLENLQLTKQIAAKNFLDEAANKK